MAGKLKTVALIGAFVSLLWLSACSSGTPTATPTIDLNPVRTEVAATVFAQVTADLARTPSATLVPSFTPTSPPTATLTQAATATLGPIATLPGGTPGVSTTDLAEWVSQSIADDTIFAPGETFTITWRLKNAGSSTWTIGYLLRFYSGDTFGAPTEILLSRVALPGETVDISVPMRAPNNPGNYRTDWVMSNASRSNFKEPVFLKIIVAAPLTPTQAPAATSTP